MPSIYPVPLTSAQGVGNTSTVSPSNQREQMTFAINGLTLDVSKGQKLDAILKVFTLGKNPQLIFPGNPPIDLDAQVAALLVPKATESMSLSFSIVRQNPGTPVELLLLKATPVPETPSKTASSPPSSTSISSAGLSLQQALQNLSPLILNNSDLGPPASIAPNNEVLNRLAPSTTQSTTVLPSVALNNSTPTLTPSLLSASDLQSFAASGTSMQSVMHLAEAFSLALPQIPQKMGLGYERSLAQWVERGADLEQLAFIKNSFPQAQTQLENNPFITHAPNGALTPSALSIGQQALSIEQHGYSWNGYLTPNIQAHLSLHLSRPIDFPSLFIKKDDPSSNSELSNSSSSKNKLPTYLRMHLKLDTLQDVYIWGIHYQGTSRIWVRFVNPQSAQMIEQVLPLFHQTLMDKRIELTLLSKDPV